MNASRRQPDTLVKGKSYSLTRGESQTIGSALTNDDNLISKLVHDPGVILPANIEYHKPDIDFNQSEGERIIDEQIRDRTSFIHRQIVTDLLRIVKDPVNWIRLVLISLIVFVVIYNGWMTTPLIFLLYLPILLSILQGRALLGLVIGITMSIVYVYCSIHYAPAVEKINHYIIGAALAFPAIAVYSLYLNRRMEDRLQLLKRQSQELKTLLDMSQLMDSAYDLSMTLDLIILKTQEVCGCQVCAIYLYNKNDRRLELKTIGAPDNRSALLTALDIDDAQCGHWNIDTSPLSGDSVVAFYTPETSRNPLISNCRLFHIDPRARSFLCVPLTSVEGLLGMLYVGFDIPNSLSEKDIKRIENLATRAAFPLQRLLLQQGYQSLAFSDSKTGLDNHRQYEANLSCELSRSDRYGHKLSVLLMDLDHFKEFNDTYGHVAGDALLAQLAVVIRNSLRSHDKPARYGGEEFAVICPETGKEEARLVAERIRKNIGDTEFAIVTGDNAGPNNPAKAKISVSIGFATFPQDAHNAKELTQNADDALYSAKRAGRNIVRGYEDVSTRKI